MKSLLFAAQTNDAHIIDMIQKGDEKALVTLYTIHKKIVVSFIRGKGGTEIEADDLFQEALVILWERVRTGRYEHAAKISTFLIGIIKRLMLRQWARQKRESSIENMDESFMRNDVEVELDYIENEHALIVKKALEELDELCRKILLFFYWEELSMEKIAALVGLANAETAKAKKYQCKKYFEKTVKRYLDVS